MLSCALARDMWFLCSVSSPLNRTATGRRACLKPRPPPPPPLASNTTSGLEGFFVELSLLAALLLTTLEKPLAWQGTGGVGRVTP